VIRAATSSAVGSVPKIGGDYARYVASRQQTEYLIAPSVFGEDEHPSKIIRDKSDPGDRLGEVYDRMLSTDATLAGLWEKRCKAVLGLPWSIIPGDESDEARAIADTVSEMLYGIRNLEVNLAHQLGATARGCAFDEMAWGLQRQRRGRLTGLWLVNELVDRPMWRFGFKQDVLHVRRRDATLEPVPAGRILHLAHGTKDTKWGDALLDKVWWFYWLSLHAWKYFGVAIEKWAQPTVLVPYARNEDKTVNEATIALALQVAADIQTEYAAAIPDDVKVQLLEAQRGGSVSYDGFLHLLDRAKALFFLGEVDTSGLSQGPGSFAKNTVSNEVRYETILSDASELANSLTDGLITPFVQVNFGLDAPLPYFDFDVEEASDRKLRQDGVAAVLDRDLEVPLSYVYRVHQVPQPKAGEVTVKAHKPAAPAFPPPAPVPVNPDGDEASASHWSEKRWAA
jgi:phage gp29-like protein